MDAIGPLVRCHPTVKALIGMFLFAVAAAAFVLLAPTPATPAEAAVPDPERPWLSREAADHIIGPGGTLGPLFVGVTLGGSAPSIEVREHIAAFARANDVAIDFEVLDDELVAIRFDVTFGGCCGYEGVDALARRIGRPRHLAGCSGDDYFYDNWAVANEDGTHVRGTVNVNRLRLRWERTLSFAELAARAEDVLGMDRGLVGEGAGDRWIELEPMTFYLLELPHPFVNHHFAGDARPRPEDRGLTIRTDQRIVTVVTFTVAAEDGAHDGKPLVARWGKPRVGRDGEWMWVRGDRTITAQFHDRGAEIQLVASNPRL